MTQTETNYDNIVYALRASKVGKDHDIAVPIDTAEELSAVLRGIAAGIRGFRSSIRFRSEVRCYRFEEGMVYEYCIRAADVQED